MSDIVGNTLKSVDHLKGQFKRVNNEISLLPKWLDKMQEIESETTEIKNSIYHALEVKDFNAVEKSKIIKVLQDTLRKRREAKKVREMIELFIESIESQGVTYKPFANEDLDKRFQSLKNKHVHIDKKSRSSAEMISEIINREVL